MGGADQAGHGYDRIALTGGIATGKSYVLQQFRQRGVPCLDADLLAHGVIAPGTEATARDCGAFRRRRARGRRRRRPAKAGSDRVCRSGSTAAISKRSSIPPCTARSRRVFAPSS